MPNGEIQKVKKVKINQMTFWAVTKDEKVHFINSENLTLEQLQFISSYVPEYKNDFEVPFSLEDRSLNQENPNIEAFIQQINELRQEKQEVLNDFYDFRISLEKNVDIIDEKDLHSLKDDVQFFTAENLELRLKIKHLIE